MGAWHITPCSISPMLAMYHVHLLCTLGGGGGGGGDETVAKLLLCCDIITSIELELGRA